MRPEQIRPAWVRDIGSIQPKYRANKCAEAEAGYASGSLDWRRPDTTPSPVRRMTPEEYLALTRK